MVLSKSNFNAIKMILPTYLRVRLFRLKASLFARYFKLINCGKGTYIDSSVHGLGWRSIRIGNNCVISESCWFNVNHRNSSGAKITVGSHSYIGRRNFFSEADLIELGEFSLTGTDCRFMGADHIFSDPSRPYVSTGVTETGVIRLGHNCWLGAAVMIIGNVNIGSGCVIGAGSFVRHDVPAFSVAVGNPAVVIKRYSFAKQKWLNVKDFGEDDESSLPNSRDYLTTLRANFSGHMPLYASGVQYGELP